MRTRSTSVSTYSAIVSMHMTFAKLRDGLDHGFGARVGDRIANEAAVDLDVVDRQILQVGQRAYARAEIVQRELAAEFLQRAHEDLRLLEIADRRRLGQLEAQHARRQPLALI